MSLKNIITLAIIPQILLVKWLAKNSNLVETYYSNSLYPKISAFFRTYLGQVSFSIGDILYILLIILAINYVYRTLMANHRINFIRDILMVLSIAYFTFHMMWGLNYYRDPLSEKLNLTESKNFEELVVFTKQLTKKTNETHIAITQDSKVPVTIPYSQQEIYNKTILGYDSIAKKHPFLAYKKPSIKTSLFSTILSYMGYAGYLNPFTNEAQVNGLLPKFRFPIVAGHEIGHQLGYAAENETNFIGYLVTRNNSNPHFKYAANAYALSYCLSDIRRRDKEMFNSIIDDLNPGVKANFNEMSLFWESYNNPMEPIFKWFYSGFLKANNQPEGIKSYNAMVRLLVPYHQNHPL